MILRKEKKWTLCHCTCQKITRSTSRNSIYCVNTKFPRKFHVRVVRLAALAEENDTVRRKRKIDIIVHYRTIHALLAILLAVVSSSSERRFHSSFVRPNVVSLHWSPSGHSVWPTLTRARNILSKHDTIFLVVNRLACKLATVSFRLRRGPTFQHHVLFNVLIKVSLQRVVCHPDRWNSRTSNRRNGRFSAGVRWNTRFSRACQLPLVIDRGRLKIRVAKRSRRSGRKKEEGNARICLSTLFCGIRGQRHFAWNKNENLKREREREREREGASARKRSWKIPFCWRRHSRLQQPDE